MFPKPFLHMRTFKLKLDFCKQGEKNELSPIKPKILFIIVSWVNRTLNEAGKSTSIQSFKVRIPFLTIKRYVCYRKYL